MRLREPTLEGETEALVRPLAVSNCDLDGLIIRGTVPIDGPFPFGHECVAEVIDVGQKVQKIAVGDLVCVPFQISCGTCEQCARGRTAHCTGVPAISMYGLGSLSGAQWGGFLSDVVRVPFAEHMLIPVPAGVEPQSIASLSDNVVDAWRTVAPALRADPGAAVLIVTRGMSVGLYAAAIAIALGASQVDYLGGREHDRQFARQVGARVIDGPIPDRLCPYPITVNASGNQDALTCAIHSTAPDGICTSIGIYFAPETPLPLLAMYTHGIHFHTGRVHARTVMPHALELVKQHKRHPELVTSQVVDWQDAPAALAEHYTSKLVITRGAG